MTEAPSNVAPPPEPLRLSYGDRLRRHRARPTTRGTRTVIGEFKAPACRLPARWTSTRPIEARRLLSLPGADLSNEELVRVVPRQADEFTCTRCLPGTTAASSPRPRATRWSARSARPDSGHAACRGHRTRGNRNSCRTSARSSPAWWRATARAVRRRAGAAASCAFARRRAGRVGQDGGQGVCLRWLLAHRRPGRRRAPPSGLRDSACLVAQHPGLSGEASQAESLISGAARATAAVVPPAAPSPRSSSPHLRPSCPCLCRSQPRRC